MASSKAFTLEVQTVARVPPGGRATYKADFYVFDASNQIVKHGQGVTTFLAEDEARADATRLGEAAIIELKRQD